MKPLTRKQRSSSLLILGIIFLLLAPVIVLYSLGYRLDNQYSLQKTGGIFIHSSIANSSVYVDNHFFKATGIFIRNTLIQDLTPNKKYTVRIEKEGYQTWSKDIAVYSSFVSEGTVLMLPNAFETREIFKYLDMDGIATSTPRIKFQPKPTNPDFIEISKLFASTTKVAAPKKISLFGTTTATSTPIERSDLETFFDTLHITNFENLKNFIVNGKEVSWLDAGNINLYWTDDLVSIPYYYCGGEERVCTNKITLDWGDEIKKFAYLPGRNDVWIILTSHGIYAVEVDGRTQRNIQTIYKGENLDFQLTQTDRLIIKEGSKFLEISL
jgi:PEGA domain